jgi:hypothetical protein
LSDYIIGWNPATVCLPESYWKGKCTNKFMIKIEKLGHSNTNQTKLQRL